jgi:iron(III) transport system substrate-binding protein
VGWSAAVGHWPLAVGRWPLFARILLSGILFLAAPASAKELHLYTALDTLEAQIYIDAFTEDTGIPVRWVRLSAGEILTRIRTERARPQASVWYGGPSLDLLVAARDELLEPYRPTTFDAFPKNGRDTAWRWSGIYLGLIGFASNPKLLARHGALPPTSWRDLLRPQLRGEVSMAYAYTSGTSYTVIASLVQLFGEDSSMLYLRDLDRNIHHYNRSGSACVTQVGLGEIGTCVAFSHDVLTKGTKKGYPVVLTFPSEGTGYEIGGIALVRGAPEPDEARRFVDWALTLRAQSLLSRWNRLPIREDAPVAPGVPPPASLKLIDFDPVRASEDRNRIVDEWREMTGQ